MNERRVRPLGRQVYGRPVPLTRPNRRVRPPRVQLWQWRLAVLVLAAGLTAVGLGHLFAATKVEVDGPPGAAALQPDVVKIMAGSWQLGNLITFDSGLLVSKLQQVDPGVRSASVIRRPLHTIAVTVALKHPSLGWSTGDQKYLLDSDGSVIGPFGSASLPVVEDGSNLPVHTGQQVVSTHFVAFVSQLVPDLAADGVSVSSLSIKDTTLDLTVGTNKGYNLIFDTSRAAGDEVQDLKAVQSLLASQKAVPASYIDLRIAGKAYYK